MTFKVNNYLLVDIDNQFSRAFAKHYFTNTENSNLVVAGANSRHMVKLMFEQLVIDYCYCDFSNEISVSELASYLHEHHNIQGVLINHTDYQLANDAQKFIYNSLHKIRYLIQQDGQSFSFTPCPDTAQINHLSCQSEIAETSAKTLRAKDEFK